MNLNKKKTPQKGLLCAGLYFVSKSRESKEVANSPLRMRIKVCSCALFTGIRQGRSRRECTHFLCAYALAIHPARVKRDWMYHM